MTNFENVFRFAPDLYMWEHFSKPSNQKSFNCPYLYAFVLETTLQNVSAFARIRTRANLYYRPVWNIQHFARNV